MPASLHGMEGKDHLGLNYMETSIEIFESLTKTNKEAEKESILSEIDEEHDIWFYLYHILNPLREFPFKFKLSDPQYFSNGVKDGILRKIIEKVEYGELSEENAADAMAAFSHYCSEKQWFEWYKPFLEKDLSAPITVALFNKYCPEKYRISFFQMSTITPLDLDSTLTSSVIIEPFYEHRRVFVILKGNRVWICEQDGTPLDIEIPPSMKKARIPQMVIFEAYENEGYFIVRDIMLEDQILGKTSAPQVEERLRVAEDALKTILGVEFDTSSPFELIEYYVNRIDKEPEILNEDLDILFESGHIGVVFRNSHTSYQSDQANIVVKPSRKSVLTCTDIIDGQEGTKYEGKALYLAGRGTMNKKKFISKVRLGLTLDQRELCLVNQDEYKGRKFLVLSCGLDKEGQQLLFPVFQEWR